MINHSPAPWTMGRKQTGDLGYTGHSIRDRDGIWIASVMGVHVRVPLEHIEANARLITAAPDLLEAAKWAETQLSYARRLDQNADHCDKVDALRAAIAKAEGVVEP